MNESITAKRINSFEEIHYFDDDKSKPKEICYWKDAETGLWEMYFPPNQSIAALAKHKVVENMDGTITVSPSILVENHRGIIHGFLENGVWREA